MSVDREFRIRIVTTSESAGAKQSVAELEKVEKATGKINIRNKELKEIVKGVAGEFPGLAAAGRLAMSPIAFAVTGIVSAFALWKHRVDNLTNAFANLELPAGSAMDPAHVNSVAKAWGKYAESVARLREGAGGKEISADLNQSKLQVDTRLKEIEAMGNADLAGLKQSEAEGKISSGEARLKRVQIESALSRVRLEAEARKEEAELQAKLDQSAEDVHSAAKKRAEASKIRIASEEDDAQTEADLAAQAKVAEEDIKRTREKVGQLRELSEPVGGKELVRNLAAGVLRGKGPSLDPIVGAVKGWWKDLRFRADYGFDATPTDAIEIEESKTAAPQIAINRFNAFRRDRVFRRELQSTRDRLLGQAAQEQVAGETAFYHDYPRAAEAAATRQRGAANANAWGDVVRTTEAVTEQTQELKALEQAYREQTNTTGAVKDAILQNIQKDQEILQQLKTQLEQKIQSLNRQFKNSL